MKYAVSTETLLLTFCCYSNTINQDWCKVHLTSKV